MTKNYIKINDFKVDQNFDMKPALL